MKTCEVYDKTSFYFIKLLYNYGTMLNTQYVTSIKFISDSIMKEKEYPFSLPVIKKLKSIEFSNSLTIIAGDNGTGKSTIIEAIAFKYGFNLEGGSRNFNFETKKINSMLGECMKIARGYRKPKDAYFFRAESFYNLASNIDEIGVTGSYGGISLHNQSHGESFFSLFLNRLRGEGFYLFDEPEAVLSPQRQLAFVARMNELINKGSQFIIATHSPIIMAYPEARILQLSEDGIKEVTYEKTDCYQFYKLFINDYEQVLRQMRLK